MGFSPNSSGNVDPGLRGPEQSVDAGVAPQPPNVQPDNYDQFAGLEGCNLALAAVIHAWRALRGVREPN